MPAPFDETEYDRWMSQAESTLDEADVFVERKLYHWSCFAAQQAAEAALKAVLRGLGKPVVTHSLKQLFDMLDQLGVSAGAPERHAGRVLERHYKGTRYPDQYVSGTPRDHYDQQIADEAMSLARTVVAFAKQTREALR